MQPSDNSILAEIRASGRLPSPTGVALTILELTRDPNVSINDMAKVLQGDPSLAGRIIKYANSAAAGSREPVASINDALVRLGMRLVKQLCLGFSLLSNSRSGHCEQFDYTAFWAHSLAMASSCQTLARIMGTISPDEGFTCGLLSEIGGLALASVYPEAYGKVLTSWGGGAREHLLQIEQRELSIDRNQVTAALFEDWGLPDFYPQAVLHKDETSWADLSQTPPVSEPYAKLANLLFASNLAAEICMTTGRDRHWRVLDLMNFARLFRLDEAEWTDVYNEILEEWARMGEVLDVVTGQLPTMVDMLHRARRSSGGDDVPDGVIDDRHRPRASDLSKQAPDDATADNSLDNTNQKLRIILATDCPLHKAILTRRLSAAGHQVTCAENGRKALELALDEPPQLIISDWMLREMDGLELCRTLRSSPQLDHIHFIIMTSHDSNEELVEAFEAGINYYLVKPLNQHILTALLRGAAREVANREEVQRQKEELRHTNAQVSIANRALKTMALEDQLTELPNRRAGLEGLERARPASPTRRSPPPTQRPQGIRIADVICGG